MASAVLYRQALQGPLGLIAQMIVFDRRDSPMNAASQCRAWRRGLDELFPTVVGMYLEQRI
jgi:hypothetical protein